MGRISALSIVGGQRRPGWGLHPSLIGMVTAFALGAGTGPALAGEKEDIQDFLRMYPKLTESEILQVEDGGAIAKILDTTEKEEVVIFGAVKLDIPVQAFIEHIRDVERLEDGENYLIVKKFSDPPVAADVQELLLEDEDIEDLRDCKPGDCNVQLPAVEIGEFRSQIDWKANDVARQVNQLAQQKALEVLQRYKQGGNRALSDYRDRKEPLNIAATYEGLLKRTEALPDHLPDFYDYLLNYPSVSLEGTEEFFYWEKVAFGLKPTIRGNHVIIYGGREGNESDYVIAFKQLYSTHYFLVALDLWFCFDDPESDGIYLFTLKGSRQHGLTGFKGSILRKVVVGRTRSSVEQGLAYLKENFEGKR